MRIAIRDENQFRNIKYNYKIINNLLNGIKNRENY